MFYLNSNKDVVAQRSFSSNMYIRISLFKFKPSSNSFSVEEDNHVNQTETL